MITTSTHTEGPTQADGRRYVHERHVADDGQVFEYDWLGEQDAAPVLAARAARLTELITQQRAAQAQVAGTQLPMSKLAFRELFTQPERMGIDAFHAVFETHPTLTAEQKAALRTGLEDYKMAEHITRPFDVRVQSMIGMYTALGLITPTRMAAIIAAGNA